MTEIYRSRDTVTAGVLQSLLESEGIKTYFRNEHVSTTIIAVPEVTPALCILNDADIDRGVELIRTYLESAQNEPSQEITCTTCEETSPATFATCWSCGALLESRITS